MPLPRIVTSDQMLKLKRQRLKISLNSFLTQIFPLIHGTATQQRKSSLQSFGRSFISLASAAVHVPLFVLPVSATTSRTSTPARALSVTDAGTPVCIPSSPRWLTETTDLPRRSASARDLCTSLFTIPKTTTVFSAVSVAADVLQNARSQ